MKITSFEYSDYNWVLDKVYFSDQSLIVGRNAVGKSKTLQSHKDQGFDKVVGLRDVYFHPYSKLEEIFKSVGKTYSKHWREIKEIVFKLKSEDFQNLYNSGKCQSFKEFCDTIFL